MFHDFEAVAIDGKPRSMQDYRGRWALVVNVASQCGLTPQYEGLEALYRKYRSLGLEVLGFPCNQFGAQEPGNESEIQNFCESRFSVSFQLFAKVDVNGEGAHPLFRYLREAQPGDIPIVPEAGNRLLEHLARTRPESLTSDDVRWNFTKFLVDPKGKVVKRYEPTVTPEEIDLDLAQRLPVAS
jgi:glutathione peroxidase